MTTGNEQNGPVFGINVTPLIDVLLVLLIVFMVIVPVVPKGLNSDVPLPAKEDMPTNRMIVLTISGAINSSPAYRINQQEVAKNELPNILSAIYANRADRTLFIRSEGDLEYQQVADVIDTGHAVGVDHVALITPKIDAGQ